jgi:hypothetical protein
MNKLVLIAALAVAAFYALAPAPGTSDSPATVAQPGVSAPLRQGDDAAIESAYANRLGNQQVEGRGTVVKLLADDVNGSRHQRFIVRLDSGRTLLMAHNIDLAPRIDGLRAGDTVAFYGEYEWNPKGGVIHWTHRDPQGRHPGGWIRHGERLYE